MLSTFKRFKSGSSTSLDKHHSTIPRDRISQLPDELLELILYNLTLRDAVRTSVLSRRWRHVPSTFPTLRFHVRSMFQLSGKPPSAYAEKFVRGVNQFLDSYRGTNIVFYRISFHLPNFIDDFIEDINRWVSFPIRMGVEYLYLDFWGYKYSWSTKAGKYVLSREVFDGSKINVKKLWLIGCTLGPNFFTTQLSNLVHLVLGCMILVEHDLRSMFSCLINLKFLGFDRCTLPEKLSLGSLPLLTLHCANCAFIEFKENKLPKLENLSLWFATGTQLRDIFSSCPQQLPNLKSLRIASYRNWYKYIPKSLAVFSSVTEMSLVFLRNTLFDILKMVSILKVCPSLRKLFLETSCPRDFKRSSLDLGNYFHKSLEDVEFRGFNETPMQMKFAIYLLNQATSLKLLVITKRVKNQAWDESERQKVYEELQKFSKDTVLIVRQISY